MFSQRKTGTVGRGGQLQGAEADVVQGLVVDDHDLVGVLDELCGGVCASQPKVLFLVILFSRFSLHFFMDSYFK